MTPAFRILVDEHQDVTAATREGLLSLRVCDEQSYLSDSVEIRLGDRGDTVVLPCRGVDWTKRTVLLEQHHQNMGANIT